MNQSFSFVNFLRLQSVDFLLTQAFFCVKKSGLSPLQLVDISKLDLNRKIKKFSYSFICEKGYSPPSGGESLFVYSQKRAEPAYFANRSSARLRSFSLETRCASTCRVFVSMSVMEP